MKRAIVWIDHEKSKIFDYDMNGVHPRKHAPKYEGPVEHGQRDQEHEKQFYHHLAENLKSNDLILLVGPGMAKEEFKNHCEKHHPEVDKAIFKVDNMKGHPSKEEILAVSDKLFKEHFQWHGI